MLLRSIEKRLSEKKLYSKHKNTKTQRCTKKQDEHKLKRQFVSLSLLFFVLEK